jgi:hypothetical protein
VREKGYADRADFKRNYFLPMQKLFFASPCGDTLSP